jgi:hypothetical protein
MKLSLGSSKVVTGRNLSSGEDTAEKSLCSASMRDSAKEVFAAAAVRNGLGGINGDVLEADFWPRVHD